MLLIRIIKFDVAKNDVSPSKDYFLHETFQSVSLNLLYMSANFNNIRFYSQWNFAVPLAENPVTDII